MTLDTIPKTCEQCQGELEIKRVIVPNKTRVVLRFIAMLFLVASVWLIGMSTLISAFETSNNGFHNFWSAVNAQRVTGAVLMIFCGLIYTKTRTMPDTVRVKCKKCKQINDFKVSFKRE